MLIRVTSDLHLDVNDKFPFSFRGKDKEIFTLLAGDTSGNPKLTAKWITANLKKGCFISGNHDVYNNLGWTLNKNKEFLSKKFPIGSDILYMDESTDSMYYEIPDTDIAIVGSCMYTDYKYLNQMMKDDLENYYNSEKNRARPGWTEVTAEEINKRAAARGLNDFRWGRVKDETDERGLSLRKLVPADYEKMFLTTFDKMKLLVEEHSDKLIIMLSHHCPSPACISSRYVDSNMNASYVSDMEEFIKEHKNIKAWVCGHVHHQNSFKIGDCLIVLNPRGYERHLESSDWKPNLFIDTDKWELVEKKYSNKKLESARVVAEENMKKALAWLMW